MTKDQIRSINEHRMEEWVNVLVRGNATFLVAIGIGHGDRSGEINVCMPEGVDKKNVAGMLQAIAMDLSLQDAEEKAEGN